MLILGIDTSTTAIGAGLSDGERTASAHRLDARGHTEHLAPLIVRLLADEGAGPEDLTGIVVGTGPGPFTGLRVGIVTGLSMGHALGVPVHGLCSLDVLASAARVTTSGDLLVATDARRKEVYWARYAGSGVAERVTAPAVDRPADIASGLRELPTAGRGPVLYPDLFPSAVGPLDVDAGLLARLGAEGVAAGRRMPVEPLYLRRPDALTTAERGAVR